VRSADGALNSNRVPRAGVDLLRYPLDGVRQAAKWLAPEDDGDSVVVFVGAARGAGHPLGPDFTSARVITLQFPGPVAVLRPRRCFPGRRDQNDCAEHLSAVLTGLELDASDTSDVDAAPLAHAPLEEEGARGEHDREGRAEDG